MTDEGKLKCPYCDYHGHKPLLRIHLYMQHHEDVDNGV